MKKLILLLALTGATLFANAQAPEKKLPKEVTIKLSDAQVIAFYNKIDSVSFIVRKSKLPSDFIDEFTGRLIKAFEPLTSQINSQLIPIKADSINKDKPTAKANEVNQKKQKKDVN